MNAEAELMNAEAQRGAVAIFVKTPGLSPLKTRLARSLGRERAETFHVLAAQAVAAVVNTTAEGERWTPYWAVAEEAGLSHPLWQGCARLPQGTGSLGERLARVYAELVARHRFAIFLGADSPQLDRALLRRAAECLSRARTDATAPAFVLGRSHDGGFYLFGGATPLPPEVWKNVPYSAGNTADELARQLARHGDVEELPHRADVDTLADLQALVAEFPAPADRLPEQSTLLQWIENLFADET